VLGGLDKGRQRREAKGRKGKGIGKLRDIC